MLMADPHGVQGDKNEQPKQVRTVHRQVLCTVQTPQADIIALQPQLTCRVQTEQPHESAVHPQLGCMLQATQALTCVQITGPCAQGKVPGAHGAGPAGTTLIIRSLTLNAISSPPMSETRYTCLHSVR
jgi:hypothetical protein